MKWPTMDEFAQMVADKALDEVEYNGKTIREWTEIILATASEDVISRQAAVDALENDKEALDKIIKGMSAEDMLLKYYVAQHNQVSCDIDAIVQLPPAEPQIIRCKDCKHWIPYDWMFSEIWQSKNIADYPEDDIGCDCCDMAMKANDFCSRAERRTE